MIRFLFLILTLVASTAWADEDCIMISAESASLYSTEAHIWLAADENSFGLSCQTIESVVGKIDTATAVVKDAMLVALLNPKLSAWAAKLTLNAAKNPYVLAVLVVGTSGSVWVYHALDTAKGDCEKAEEQQKYQEILMKTLNDYSPTEAVRCEEGL